MEKNKPTGDTKQWSDLVNFISLKFGDGNKLDLQAILFLIGVHELGKGYQEFSKEEKINLLHIAICKLLSRYDYYTYVGKDKDGWPHWKTNTSKPKLQSGEETILIKESAISYFKDSGIVF